MYCLFSLHPSIASTAAGQTDKKTDGRTDRQTEGQTDRQTDGQTDGQTDRRTDRQTVGRTDQRFPGHLSIERLQQGESCPHTYIYCIHTNKCTYIHTHPYIHTHVRFCLFPSIFLLTGRSYCRALSISLSGRRKGQKDRC